MPDLVQELQPNQRGTRLYTAGVFQGYEDVYEVSDEQLAEEAEQLIEKAEQVTCGEYLTHSSDVITQPEIWYLLRAFGKKLGYKID